MVLKYVKDGKVFKAVNLDNFDEVRIVSNRYLDGEEVTIVAEKYSPEIKIYNDSTFGGARGGSSSVYSYVIKKYSGDEAKTAYGIFERLCSAWAKGERAPFVITCKEES